MTNFPLWSASIALGNAITTGVMLLLGMDLAWPAGLLLLTCSAPLAVTWARHLKASLWGAA